MLERAVEAKLVRGCRKFGSAVRCIKFKVGEGYPDRIILIRPSAVLFVEVKAPGVHLRPRQEFRVRELEALGFTTIVVSNAEQVSAALSLIKHLVEARGIL
jgi:hypothetical protein